MKYMESARQFETTGFTFEADSDEEDAIDGFEEEDGLKKIKAEEVFEELEVGESLI